MRGCNIVLGGALKVKATGKSVNVSGGAAAVTLRCVATQKCSGLVTLRHSGKTLASAKFAMGKKKSKTVRLKLNKRGLRLLAKAPSKGLKVQLRDRRQGRSSQRLADGLGLRLTPLDVPAGHSHNTPQEPGGRPRKRAASALRARWPLHWPRRSVYFSAVRPDERMPNGLIRELREVEPVALPERDVRAGRPVLRGILRFDTVRALARIVTLGALDLAGPVPGDLHGAAS